jgi:hypothetical protein
MSHPIAYRYPVENAIAAAFGGEAKRKITNYGIL